MKPGKFDRSESQWIHAADESLKKDMAKSRLDLLHSIYEQHEKTCDIRLATIEGEETKHVPIEIQLLAQKKVSCFQYKIAEEAEKQTTTIIRLTHWLIIWTFVIAIFTVVNILQAFHVFRL